MANLSLPLLVAIFLGSAAIVWWAGVRLSNTTDVLDRRLGLGDAFGGLILLAIVTNLPDIAIVSSAALSGNIGLATGTLLGTASVEMLVLVLLDRVGGANGVPLTSRTKTLVPVLSAMMVIMGLVLIVLGAQLDAVTVLRIEPVALAIFFMWLVGLLVIRKAYAGLAWNLDERDDPGMPEEPDRESSDVSTGKTASLFLFAAVITLIGGVALEQSSDAIAMQLGISDVIFGGTVLAAATAVPDISTGIQAVRLGDHQLVVNEALGAKAFMPSLFLLTGIIAGTAVVSELDSTALYFAAFAAFLTCIYLVGLVLRSDRTVFRIGLDSLAVLVAYVIGVAVLLTIG